MILCIMCIITGPDYPEGSSTIAAAAATITMAATVIGRVKHHHRFFLCSVC